MKYLITLFLILTLLAGFLLYQLHSEAKLQHCVITICKGIDGKCRELDSYTEPGKRFVEMKFPKGYMPFNARCDR